MTVVSTSIFFLLEGWKGGEMGGGEGGRGIGAKVSLVFVSLEQKKFTVPFACSHYRHGTFTFANPVPILSGIHY